MKQLAAITEFLIGLDLVAAEQIESWVENPQIVPAGDLKGANSIVLYRQKYDAQIVIERFPHKIYPAELLFGHICAWLMDNDGERSDGSEATIQTEVDVLDDGSADLVIAIDFMEDVTAIEDPAGTIQFAGKRYRLAPADIYYAETGDVIANAVTE